MYAHAVHSSRAHGENLQILLLLYNYFFSFIRAAMKKVEALNTEISEMEQQVKEVEEDNLKMKKEEVIQELDGLRVQVEDSQRRHRQLVKEQEVSKEQKAEFMGQRYKYLNKQTLTNLIFVSLTVSRLLFMFPHQRHP